MRSVLLLALLVSACDQGATAAPAPPVPVGQPIQLARSASPPPPFVRFEVRDDADFAAKAIVLLEELADLFADGSKDCELVATRVENWVGGNVTRFGVLTDYGKAHPQASQAMAKQFESRTANLMQTMMPTFTACASNERLMGAFKKISDQSEQIQQRPR